MTETARRYDLLEPLASGGMGDVYRGEARGERGFRKPVAIKRIRAELARDPDFVLRFVAEAKLAVSLSHANIVQVFDLGRSGDELLLVMEEVDGSDLNRLLTALRVRGERVPVPLAVHIGMETLKGLDYTHQRGRLDAHHGGVIHCDLSPSNVLVSFAGEVKLTDFGVAQALAVAARQRNDRVIGKVRYLAPEQLAGARLDVRTDLYALGVVLQEALTLERPFGDGDTATLSGRVLAGDWPTVAGARPDLPAELSALVASARAVEPQRRPPSARAMLHELMRIARQLEPVTGPDLGAWVEGLVPRPARERPNELTAALRRLIGAGRATHTQSVPARRSDAFVVERSVDGVTRLGRPRRRRWWWTLPVAAVLAALPLLARRHPVAPAPAGSGAARMVAGQAVAAPREQEIARALDRSATAEALAPSRPARRAAAPGFLNVYTAPWAYLFVDGRRVGTTPLLRLPLAPGRHRLRFEHPRTEPLEQSVIIRSRSTESLDLDLPSLNE